jgi:hypothetical protein
MINDSDIRKEVNAWLKPGPPLTDVEWRYLDTQGLIRERRVLKILDAGLADKVRQGRAAFGNEKPVLHPEHLEFIPRDRGGKVTDSRITAISLLAAQDAAQDAEVQAFRIEALGGRLIAYGDIAAWVESQQKKDGPATHYVTVALPVARHLVDTGAFFGADKPFKVSEVLGSKVEFLDYPKAGAKECVPVAHGATLDRLRIVCERLARRYTWWPAAAVAFVLSGAVPRVSTLSTTVKEASFPALSRIEMSIDPALSPAEVTEEYRRYRRQVLGSRYRSLSEKHNTLALFRLGRPEGETYKQSMTAWNRKYPKWKYTAETNFGRDAATAARRLVESGPSRAALWKVYFEKLASSGKR